MLPGEMSTAQNLSRPRTRCCGSSARSHPCWALLAEIFSKYDATNKGGLDSSDLRDMLHGKMAVLDFADWLAARVEWGTLFWVAANDQGILTKVRRLAALVGAALSKFELALIFLELL